MKKILFLFALVAFLSACDASTTTTQSQPSPQPTVNWQDVHSESGTGNAISQTFTVPNTWRIKWSCDPNSAQYQTYNFILYKKKTPVVASNDIPQADVNAICNSQSLSGEVDETGAGSYFLEIDVPDSWTITIQKPA